MPNDLNVLLRLDGVLHTSDLPVQSFARHLTDQLPADRVRPMIAGMRGFLEGKPELLPAGTDFGQAEDGYQAVTALAVAAGLTAAQIGAARQQSRADLASSAWAVDAPDGLEELLAELGSAVTVAVFTEPDDPAASPVLDAVDVGTRIDLLLPTPVAEAIAGLPGHPVAAGLADRILVVGARWAGELDVAAATGCATALVDRYQLGLGSPDWRATGLAGLAEPIRSWVAAGAGVGTGQPL